MSEYQYYEFQAIDRPLSEADQRALRDLSSRGLITATSFTNTYQWGDFRGDPAKLMQRCFDLHLYLANWGSRRLMVRLPTRLVDRQSLDVFLGEVDCAQLTVAGEYLILDIARDEVEIEDWSDGSGWLAALAPLRADVLSGDLRLFYLLWLTAVETDVFEDDEPEPMPGLGPMSGGLAAFAEFFGIDRDLIDAAAERPAAEAASAQDAESGQRIISALSDAEKTGLLVRLFGGDPHVVVELRAKVRDRLATSVDAPPAVARTVGELRARALALAQERERAAAQRLAAEKTRLAEEAEKARQARLVAIRRRGEGVWREVETEIERRSASAYDRAADLLADLRALADQQGAVDGYLRRLRAIREAHASKRTLIERLARLG